MSRRATPDDIDEIIAIGKSCYRAFDETPCRTMLAALMVNPSVIVLLDGGVCGLSTVQTLAWEPSRKRGVMLFLAGRPREVWRACKILRTMRDWCLGDMGADDYQFGDDTGFDFSILARRLGARVGRTMYVCGAP